MYPGYFRNVLAPAQFATHQHLGLINTFLAAHGFGNPAIRHVAIVVLLVLVATVVVTVLRLVR